METERAQDYYLPAKKKISQSYSYCNLWWYCCFGCQNETEIGIYKSGVICVLVAGIMLEHFSFKAYEM